GTRWEGLGPCPARPAWRARAPYPARGAPMGRIRPPGCRRARSVRRTWAGASYLSREGGDQAHFARPRLPPDYGLNRVVSEVTASGAVVRRLTGNRDVVGMGLPQSRRRDLHELGIPLERLDAGHTAVSHAAPEAADHLEDHVPHGPLIRHP